jgi:predicted transcriptional regulator
MDDLRCWLDASDFSVTSLATRLGVSRQAVYGWISGESLPTTLHLIKLQDLSGGRVTALSFVAAVKIT